MRTTLISFMLVALCACSPNKVVESALTTQERSVVRGAIDDISRGDSASLSAKLRPDLAPKVAPVFGQMHQLLPAAPLDLSLLNATWFVGGGARNMNAVYQVHGRSGWALVEVSTETKDRRVLLTSIYVQPTAGDPSSANGFSLAKAGVRQWGMLAAIVAAVGLTIAALFRIWRSGRFRRRWLWTIGAIIGLTTLRLNWSTGEFSFQPISFLLFSASATKQPIYAPWTLGVAFPLVALVALLRRRHHEGAVSES